MFTSVVLAFVPLFVAVDAIGVMPIFISLTEDLSRGEKIRAIIQSIITAVCLSVGFLFIGRAVLKFLNVTIGDFMVAGGILLFCLALIDIVTSRKRRRMPNEELGSVPLGTPLIAGPAVLTTSLVMLGEYGLAATLIALVINVILAGIVFLCADMLIRLIGSSGARALSKIASLLLAAIAVMLIRRGIVYIIALSM